MASSAYNELLTKEQILETKLNTCIAYKAPNTTGTRTYPIQLFCNNDDKVINKHVILVCLHNGVWHQITHNSNSGLPQLRQPLTSIHTFDIEEARPELEFKKESDNSDSESAEKDKDSDDELAEQTGRLHINNQIRDAEIPKELTPQRNTVSLPRHMKLSPISPKLSTMATSSITIQQPTDTQPLTQGGGVSGTHYFMGSKT